MEYLEKLKDPRWQKKRLEIFERDGWECKSCREKDKTLHIHHLVYSKGIEPWEISNGFLITLCEDCHNSNDFSEMVGDLLSEMWKLKYDYIDFINLTDAISRLGRTPQETPDRWELELSIKRLK